MKALFKTFAIGLTLTAAACGWHLRGALNLPEGLNSMYINSSDQYSGISAELKRALEAAGVEVTQSSRDAQMTMNILREHTERRTAAVNAQGQASEYELTMSVDYLLNDQNGKVLIPENTASVIRSYSFDPSAVSAAREEEEILRREMRADIIQQMARRMRFLEQNSAANEAADSAAAQP